MIIDCYDVFLKPALDVLHKLPPRGGNFWLLILTLFVSWVIAESYRHYWIEVNTELFGDFVSLIIFFWVLYIVQQV